MLCSWTGIPWCTYRRSGKLCVTRVSQNLGPPARHYMSEWMASAGGAKGAKASWSHSLCARSAVSAPTRPTERRASACRKPDPGHCAAVRHDARLLLLTSGDMDPPAISHPFHEQLT